MKKKTLSVIGKPLRKIDAMAKCAGETIFADDLNLPRMIYGKLLRSPHPHARILGISTARALKLDGVFAVITGEEMPEKFGIMPSTQDEEALVIDKARYAGDPVAAVKGMAEAIRNNDLVRYSRLSMPPKLHQRMEARWKAKLVIGVERCVDDIMRRVDRGGGEVWSHPIFRLPAVLQAIAPGTYDRFLV